MAALETIQQTSSVAEYISRFASLSQYTQLNDPGLMRWFYRGLKGTVKDELATRDYKSLVELQALATRLDARLHERTIERSRELKLKGQDANSAFKINLPPKPGTTAPVTIAPPLYKSHFSPNAVTPRVSSAPAMDGSTPMELDSQQSRRLSPEERDRYRVLGLCWYCKKQGHRQKECPELLKEIMNVELNYVQEPTEKDSAQE